MDWQLLAAPFAIESHKWRVMNLTNDKTKGKVAFYIDARDVMDRLDKVVGPGNWSTVYKPLITEPKYWAVECTLTIEGIAKSDVGDGDASEKETKVPAKDAYSDALKRAAVQFGVGRYLYSLDTGYWYPVNEWRQFTDEAEKQIEKLLEQNLARLMKKLPQKREEKAGENPLAVPPKKEAEEPQSAPQTGIVDAIRLPEKEKAGSIRFLLGETEDLILYFRDPLPYDPKEIYKKRCEFTFVLKEEKGKKWRFLQSLTLLADKPLAKTAPDFRRALLQIAEEEQIFEADLAAYTIATHQLPLQQLTIPVYEKVLDALRTGAVAEWCIAQAEEIPA